MPARSLRVTFATQSIAFERKRADRSLRCTSKLCIASTFQIAEFGRELGAFKEKARCAFLPPGTEAEMRMLKRDGMELEGACEELKKGVEVRPFSAARRGSCGHSRPHK